MYEKDLNLIWQSNTCVELLIFTHSIFFFGDRVVQTLENKILEYYHRLISLVSEVETHVVGME